MRDGLSALGMAVLCPFRRSSMCRYVYRELTRNEVLDLTTIIPAAACQQKNYVGTYSRFIRLSPQWGGKIRFNLHKLMRDLRRVDR